MPMNTDEIVGTVDGVFGSLSVQIKQHVDGLISGMLNKFKPKNKNVMRLNTAIDKFMESEFQSAIITSSGTFV